MNFFESLSFYGDSIIKVSVGYIISVLIFSIYNKRKYLRISKPMLMFEKLIWRTLTIFPVAFTAGIRGWTTGTDTRNTWLGYLSFSNKSYDYVMQKKEIGKILYDLIAWIFSKITNGNVQIFLFMWAFATVYFILLGIEKWNLKYAGFSLFIFYCCFGLLLMNQMRQLLSVAILFYAYFYMFHGNTKTFFILSFIASFIHFSAFVAAIIIWYLLRPRLIKSSGFLYWFILIVTCLFLPKLIVHFGELFFSDTRYEYIAEAEKADSIGLGLILTLVPAVLPVIIWSKRLDVQNKLRNTIYLVFPARLSGYYSFFLSRFVYYFGIVNIIAFPMIIENENTKHKKISLIFISACCLTYFFVYYCWLCAEVYFPYVTFMESGIRIY